MVAVLGAWVYFVESPRMQADKAPDRLLTLDSGAVNTVTLSYAEAPTIELVRQDDRWQMTEPVATAADKLTVERLLTTIAELELERRIDADQRQALEVYGLGEQGEQANITLGLADGTTLPTIIVGRTTPVGFSAFARLADSQEVTVTPLIFHTGVKKTLFDMREKRLLQFNPANVIGLELSSPETGRITIERHGDRWRITEPVVDEADSSEVGALLASVPQIKASAFHDGEDPGRKFGLKRPTLSLAMKIGGHGWTRLALGGEVADSSPPAIYAARLDDGQVVEVDRSLLVMLGKDLAALRNKRLFHCEAGEVTRITFERAGSDGFAIEQNDTGHWALGSNANGSLNQALVERVRNGLADMAGARVIEAASDDLGIYGLAQPETEVELFARDGSSCGRALASKVAEGDGSRYFVKRHDGDMVMGVPEYLYSRLDRMAADLFEKQ